MRYYVGLLRKDEQSDFGIEFPDFPGCISAGSSLHEVAAMGAKALSLHARGMIQDGEAIPDPTPLELLERDDAVAVLVPLELPQKTKSIPINITIDEGLLRTVDTERRRRGQSRSAFLAEAARKAL